MIITQKYFKPSILVAAIFGTVAAAPAIADSESFISDSKVNYNLRYRLETVDQDGIDESALASTLKARVTWASGSVSDFKLNAELDHVMTLGADDYNDASGVNPNAAYPVVADPTGTDVNQLNVAYAKDNLSVIAGRQRIVLGNQRFVGGVAWRQNEQTYDGVRAKYKLSDQLTLDYSYITKVNRIFGPDGAKAEADGGFQLFNADYKINSDHKVTGFAYLLDYDNAADSLNTFGVDYLGKVSGVQAHASFATQSNGDYSASYLALDA
ncbi:MAG: alginate export family protein, partial [Psychrobium sp.]